MKKILLSFFIGIMLIACSQKTVSVREVWTKEQANEWYQQWGWLRGCDFIRARQSTNWRCGRLILLIRLLLIVNWVGRRYRNELYACIFAPFGLGNG